MKDFIIAFLICLALSCWVNDFGAEPHTSPIGIGETVTGPLPVQREESWIPEMNMSDGARPSGIITTIRDSKVGNRENLLFPLGANN